MGSPSTSKHTTNKTKPIVIFVHGLYGSHLTDDRDGKHVWISVWTVLASLLSGTHKVSLPLTWNGQNQDTDALMPSGLVEDFCKPWLEFTTRLTHEKQAVVLDFLWDWRRSVEETSAKFMRWILNLRDNGTICTRVNQKRPPVVLVSYSTGSMLAWPTVNEYPELFDAWISVGGAIGAGSFMLRDHAVGWRIYKPLCAQILTAETCRSLASTYSFYPVLGEPGTKGMFIDHKTKRNCEVDLLDASVWKVCGLGIYGSQTKNSLPTLQEETHLKNCLLSTKRFRMRHFVRSGVSSFDDPAFLAHPEAERYAHLRIVCFGSRSFDATHKGWYCFTKEDGSTVEHIAVEKDETMLTGSGDGTVMECAWNTIPGGLPFETVLTDKIHLHLMRDKKLIHIVSHILELDNDLPLDRGEAHLWPQTRYSRKVQIQLMFLAVLIVGIAITLGIQYN